MNAYLRPLMQVEQNAEPAAQAVSDQAIRPAGKAVAENAGPAAKSATDSTIRPAARPSQTTLCLSPSLPCATRWAMA